MKYLKKLLLQCFVNAVNDGSAIESVVHHRIFKVLGKVMVSVEVAQSVIVRGCPLLPQSDFINVTFHVELCGICQDIKGVHISVIFF